MGESKDEKTSIWKKIGIAIAGFFAGIVALLLGGLLHKRGGADEVRDDITNADAANRDAKESVESAKQSVDRLEKSNRESEESIKRAEDSAESIGQSIDDIEQCNKECTGIIDDIRKRGKKE